MNTSRSRLRLAAAPLFVGLVALLGVACAPPAPTPTGITFTPPAVGYIGKQYVPTAKAVNKLPVQFALGAESAGCSLSEGVISFESAGNCIVVASQTGETAHPAVTRTIKVQECPPLRAGHWTGPQGTSAEVNIGGSTFWGTVNLSALGFGVQPFDGTIDCDVVRMTFNGVNLNGRLSPDGTKLTGSYQGISVVLNAPAA